MQPSPSPNIFENALVHFGGRHQIVKAIEELSECVAAAARYLNTPVTKITVVGTERTANRIAKEAFIEEVADAYIMLEQMSLLLGNEAVKNAIAFKIDRLAKRLAEESKPNG